MLLLIKTFKSVLRVSAYITIIVIMIDENYGYNVDKLTPISTCGCK
jgi:hypothetical protein